MTMPRSRTWFDRWPGLATAACLVVLLTASSAGSQEVPAPSDAAGPAAPPPQETAYPGAYRVVPELLALVDEAAEARRTLAGAARVAAAEPELGRMAERRERLSAALGALRGQTKPRLDSLAAVHDHAERQRESFDRRIAAVSERLARVDAVRRVWGEKLDFWTGWRDHLRDDPQFAPHDDEFARARGVIEEVRAEAESVYEPLLARQRQLQASRRSVVDLAASAGDVLAERRRRLFEVDAPPLLSAEYRAQLGPALAAVPAGVARVPGVGGAFVCDFAWLIALQLLVVVAVALVARRVRRLDRGDDRWAVLLGHPWAMGVFVAVATLGFFYEPSPPLWSVGLWLLLGGSASLLASGMFRRAAKRWIVYALAAFYVGLSTLTAIAFPDPLLRLAQAGVCLAGVPWLLWLAWRVRRSAEPRPGFVLALRLGAAILVVVLLGQLAGFNAFSQWLLDSALASAYLGFAAIFLVRLGRGAIRALTSSAGRFPRFARVGPLLTDRLVWIYEIAVAVWAVLYGLAIWEVYDGPWQAWTDLVSKGVTLGEQRLTVGQVLLAVAAIYAAMLISRLLRSLLDDEWVEHRELDRGVADSVRTLLHYVLIVAGFFVALSLAGFDLRNFAIVAGALGVGIGFGLQNVVNNFVSGLILLFERPVRAGDVIVLGGEWGKIERIGLRSTVVTTFDQSELIVPNSELISQRVTNWTLSSRMARILIPVGVAYGSDLEAVIRNTLAVAADHPEVLAEPTPSCYFAGFGDSSLDFELRVWVDDVDKRLTTRSELLTELDRRFRAAGVEIPFPQRDLHLRSVDPAAAAGLKNGE